VESADQILSRGGVDGRLASDRGVHHRDQSRGHLDDGDSPHESGGDEAREISDYTTAERDYRRVPAESFGEQLVGQTRPRFARLVGLARRNREDFQRAFFELVLDLAAVQRLDVRIGDESVPVGRCMLTGEFPNFGQQGGAEQDRTPAETDLAEGRGLDCLCGARLTAYQVTSPAPVRTFATRASMKRRSESRFR
jgi:hypothetical protein